MLLLRHNSSLPDLDASSFRLRSSTYPSYGTIPSKQFTHSPSEEVLSNYVHTTLPSQPPYSMYSSSLHDQREESLVDPWLPSAAGASADVSQQTEISSTLSKPTYSPSHPVSSTNDPARHPRFVHTPGGSPSARHQSFPSHPTSIDRHVSEPNIRSVAAQPAPHYPLSNPTETRYQRQHRRPQHRRSFQHSVTPAIPSPSSASFSADRRPSTAGSAASSGWELEPRGDIRAEPLQEVTAVTPSHDLPPITAGDQNTSRVERYHPVFSNPFSEQNIATRSRSSGGDPLLHSETTQTRRHSPASSLVAIARSVVSEEEQDAAPPDASASKTYSFVSLPGNAVRKRPRRRYDEIERLYHCSWAGCTKSYGTLNHLNAHIVMQRHGSKRTPTEFKELRKQWRKAKKDESERITRLERVEERFNNLRSESTMQYAPQSYERQPRPSAYGRQQLYGPGIPGPDMEQQAAAGETMPRYPISTETSSMRPQPLQQQYGYPISGAAHSLYPVVPTTPIPSSWPDQSTQYEGASPPQQGGPTPSHGHLPAQGAYDYERERPSQGQSWTPPSLPHSRPVPSYEVSPSYMQPQSQSQQRVNTLPPDSTLLTPLPGYQPSTVEHEYEEEYDSKQQFWTDQQH